MQFKQVMFFFVFIASALIFAGCSGGYTKIHSLHMTISESPEVHGANTTQAPHSASWRLTGKVNHISTEEVTEKDATYRIGGTDFSGKIDFLYKLDGFTFGSGVGYKDGIYHHFTLGTNLEHFELGVFFGFYHQYIDMEYSGSRCQYSIYLFGEKEEECDTFNEDISRFYMSPFLGAYVGVIMGDLFLNYSVSTYTPNIDVEGNPLDLAAIATQYITLGYRISKWVELSAGASITYLNVPHWHYGFTGGISIYAL